MDTFRVVVYVVKPRQALIDRLRDEDPDIAKSLLNLPGYHAFEKDDPDWLPADRIVKTKLMFLVNMQGFVAGQFETLLGSTSLCEALFDRWWTMERHEAPQDLCVLEPMLAFGAGPPTPSGSERVDQWLSDFRKRTNKGNVGTILFHSKSELAISPLIRGVWDRPILEVLTSSGAHVSFGNMVESACAAFLAWCRATNNGRELVTVMNVPAPVARTDPYDWYDQVMAHVGGWKDPPYLVDLEDYLITHRGEVLWPEEKRGAQPRKDPRSKRAGSEFLWGWFGQDLGDYREGENTYDCYPIDSLPPISRPLHGTFDWLRAAADPGTSIGRINESARTSLLAEKGLTLPGEFVEFVRSPELWRKIRSCTDCYLHLDPASTPIPGGLGRLVRFLSDSQGCLHWHLHLSPCGARHAVVATYRFTGSENAHLEEGKPHRQDITACADSFEEFLYRFWMENELWFALNMESPMPTLGDEYLAHYRK